MMSEHESSVEQTTKIYCSDTNSSWKFGLCLFADLNNTLFSVANWIMSKESHTQGNESQHTEEMNDQALSMPQQMQNGKRNNRDNSMADPSAFANMGMLNPMQYQQLQQMMLMQQFQRQQMTSAAMAAAAAAAASNSTTPMKTQQKIPSESQEPPAGYVCFKCGQPGHWIYYCPNVPKGQYVPRAGGNRNQAGQQQQNNAQLQTPHEFTCMICNKLMADATLVPCCGKSFCKKCITAKLQENNHCPYCNQENTSSEQLIPNKTLRRAIEVYIDENLLKREENMDVDKTTQPSVKRSDSDETTTEGSKDTTKMDSASNAAEQNTAISTSEPTNNNDDSNEQAMDITTSTPSVHERKPAPVRKYNNNNNMSGFPRPDMFNNNMMMPPDMNWMNMMRPPFMNAPLLPGAIPPPPMPGSDVIDMGFRPPFMPGFPPGPAVPPFPPGAMGDFGAPPPFPGLPGAPAPPPEFFGFNMGYNNVNAPSMTNNPGAGYSIRGNGSRSSSSKYHDGSHRGQQNDSQHNDSQQNNSQHNDSQHTISQHKDRRHDDSQQTGDHRNDRGYEGRRSRSRSPSRRRSRSRRSSSKRSSSKRSSSRRSGSRRKYDDHGSSSRSGSKRYDDSHRRHESSSRRHDDSSRRHEDDRRYRDSRDSRDSRRRESNSRRDRSRHREDSRRRHRNRSSSR